MVERTVKIDEETYKIVRKLADEQKRTLKAILNITFNDLMASKSAKVSR